MHTLSNCGACHSVNDVVVPLLYVPIEVNYDLIILIGALVQDNQTFSAFLGVNVFPLYAGEYIYMCGCILKLA